MSVYSYSLLNGQITKRIIESNEVLLNQYANTIDTLVLNVLNETVHEIILNIKTNNELNYYLHNPVEGYTVGILKVKEYLEKLKPFNSLIHSVAIYYKKTNLLITTNSIRYCFDKYNKTIHSAIVNRALGYYDNLINSISSDVNNIDRQGLTLDMGINLSNGLNEDVRNVPKNVIHFLRTITESGELCATVIVTINGDALKDALKNYAPNDLENFTIVDEDGVILLHLSDQHIGDNIKNLEYGIKAFDSNKREGHYISKIEKNSVVISFQTSSNNNWKYISITSMLSFKTVTKLIIHIIVSAALFSLIIGFVISYIMAKGISKPIKEIAEYCNTIYEEKTECSEYLLINKTIVNLDISIKEKECEIRKAIPKLRKNFLNWVLSNNITDLKQMIGELKNMKIEFPYPNYCLAVSKIREEKDSSIIWDKINIIQKEINTPYCISTFCVIDGIIFFLTNYNCTRSHLIDLFKRSVYYGRCNGIIVHTVIGYDLHDISQICESRKILMQGLNYCYLYPERDIFFVDEIIKWENNASSINKILFNNFKNSIISASTDDESIINDLNEIINDLRFSKYRWKTVFEGLLKCVSIVVKFLLPKDLKKQILINDFKKTTDIFDFYFWMTNIVKQALCVKNICNNYINYSDNDLIEASKNYIKDNLFDSQLSLEKISDKVGVSPTYLSKIFSDKNNITVIEYITNLKMFSCRKLLTETDFKIIEISKKAGYSSPQYFTMSFKKIFGCTPNAYRNEFKKGF